MRTADEQRRRGWQGPGVAIGVAAVLAAMVVVGIAADDTPERVPAASVVDVHVLDDESAIVVWEADGGWWEGAWVSRIDPERRFKWARRLPVSPRRESSIRIAGDVVGVRYRRYHGLRHEFEDGIVAFTKDGKPLWNRVLVPSTTQDGAKYETRGLVVAGRFIEFAHEEGRHVTMALDPTHGSTIWKTYQSSTLLDRERFGNDILIRVIGGAAVLDGESGRVQGVATHQGCIMGDELVVADHDRRLVAFRGRDLAVGTIAEKFQPFPASDRLPTIVGCGRYGARVVVLVEDIPESRVVFIESGRVIQSIDVSTIAGWTTQRSFSTDGALPRFVPVIQWDFDANDDRRRLVMLDLLEGRIVWQSSPGAMHAPIEVFRRGRRWYVTYRDHDGETRLATFDGDTGRLDAAITYSTFSNAGPSQVTDRTLWLYTWTASPGGELDFTAVDARTLAQLGTHDRSIREVTHEVQQHLGAPK